MTATGTIATFSTTPVLGILKACVVVTTQSTLSGGFLSGAINLRFSDEVTCLSGSMIQTMSRSVSVALIRQ
jgi:hypothetical protein